MLHICALYQERDTGRRWSIDGLSCYCYWVLSSCSVFVMMRYYRM